MISMVVIDIVKVYFDMKTMKQVDAIITKMKKEARK